MSWQAAHQFIDEAILQLPTDMTRVQDFNGTNGVFKRPSGDINKLKKQVTAEAAIALIKQAEAALKKKSDELTNGSSSNS